jgi:Flp pilus assembly pilin Flp
MNRRSREGSTLIEYILVAAISTAAIFSGVSGLGGGVSDALSALLDVLASF